MDEHWVPHGRLALKGLVDSLPRSWSRRRRVLWLKAIVKAVDYVVDMDTPPTSVTRVKIEALGKRA